MEWITKFEEGETFFPPLKKEAKEKAVEKKNQTSPKFDVYIILPGSFFG